MIKPVNGIVSRMTAADPLSRVICLPHAGGSAATFELWRAGLDAQIELCAVQYPGRDGSLEHAPISDPDLLVELLCDEIEALTELPYVLLGHSLGALMAFEVARMQRSRGQQLPRALLLSACRAPIRLPSPFIVNASKLPEEEFITVLQTLGGIPDELTDEPALREVVVSTTRKDFELVARYRYSPQERLPVPAVLYYGQQDRHVTPDMLEDWKCEFVEIPCMKGFPGGHFYFEQVDAMRTILEEIRVHLAPVTTVSII